jgi:hypothetical protein
MLYEEELPMQKLLLVATLSLGTFALAQTMDGNTCESRSADHDFYNQTVATQAKQNSLFMDSNMGEAQRADNDFYNQTVATQAKQNSLFVDRNMGEAQRADNAFYGQTVATQAEQNSLFLSANAVSASAPTESWSGTEPGSMAANIGSHSANEDVYSRTIAVQANTNRLLKEAKQF